MIVLDLGPLSIRMPTAVARRLGLVAGVVGLVALVSACAL